MFVCGDHEFYGHDFDTLRAEMRKRAYDFKNVTLLDKSSVKIGEFTFPYGIGTKVLIPSTSSLRGRSGYNVEDLDPLSTVSMVSCSEASRIR